MLGYGLVNYFIHKFSIENIIVSFLNRNVMPNLAYFVSLKVLSSTNINATKDPKEYLDNINLNFENLDEVLKELFGLFIEEEYYITRSIIEDEKSSNLEVDYQKELYKYILSSNIIASKDYDFDKATKEQVLDEGEKFLLTLFETILKNFLIDITKQISQGKYDKILSILKSEKNNFIFDFNSDSKEYFPKKQLKENMTILLKTYKKDIQDSNKSSFYNFYKDNKYLEIRNTYLETLKTQISSLGDRRII